MFEFIKQMIAEKRRIPAAYAKKLRTEAGYTEEQRIADERATEQEIADARTEVWTRAEAEIVKTIQDFTNGEGRLPEGFSEPYNTTYESNGFPAYGTPFDTYLNEIRSNVDDMDDMSGIKDWLYLDESVEINAAAAAISDWVERHFEMDGLLKEKCHKYHLDYWKIKLRLPVSRFSRGMGKIMVVADDRSRFENITEDSLRRCKNAGISFCTVLSDRKMYDLIAQEEKEIVYSTFQSPLDDDLICTWRFQSLPKGGTL